MNHGNMAILIFEINYLGDFVCMMPTIAGLREMMPHARITLITSHIGEELIRHSVLVDEVLSFDFEKYRRLYRHPVKLWKLASKLRKRGFAASISAHDECTVTALLAKMAKIPVRIGFRSRAKGSRFYTHPLDFDPDMHVIENRFRTLEVLSRELELGFSPSPVSRVPIRYSDNENEKVSRRIDALRCERIVAIHPFAKTRYKEWPLERFLQLAQEITSLDSSTGCIIFLADKPIPKILHPRIRFLERTTLLDLAAFLDKVDIFIGNNSGPMHIAAAQGTSTIWINGPSPAYWHGYWKDVYLRMISADVSCQPCEAPGVIHGKCINSDNPMLCMESIHVENVLSEVLEALRAKQL